MHRKSWRRQNGASKHCNRLVFSLHLVVFTNPYIVHDWGAGTTRCSALYAAAASLAPVSLTAAAHALCDFKASLQPAAHWQDLDASSFVDTARCFLGEVHSGMLSAVSTDALPHVANARHWLPASHALAIGSLGESLTETLYAVSRQADALVQQQLTSAPQLHLLVALLATLPLHANLIRLCMY